MKKITIYMLIVTFCILLIIITNSYVQNNNKYIKDNGIMYAITIEGIEHNSFPTGNYKTIINCQNAEGYWDAFENKMIVKNITGNPVCDVNFYNITNNDYLNNYIISRVGQSQGNGQIVLENGYRYEGKNPNNYIWFNNELWRIIGVFDSSSHGVANKNLVKIIRANTLPGIEMDPSNNNYKHAHINKILNGQYYNRSNDDSYCTFFANVKKQCDYSNTGLDSNYRNIVEYVTWYLGGVGKTGYTSEYVNDIYVYERDQNSVIDNNITTIENYVGLLYLSDYLYAVLASSCSRSSNKMSYYNNCSTNDWLLSGNDEWTITHDSKYSGYTFSITASGSVSHRDTRDGINLRPVVYLSENVYRVSGTGTIIDPYIIGIVSS